MPEQRTLKKARKARRQGKTASTQAGQFVRETIHHIRKGKHGARSAKQAIAIGLSKARRAGVKLPTPRRSARPGPDKTQRCEGLSLGPKPVKETAFHQTLTCDYPGIETRRSRSGFSESPGTPGAKRSSDEVCSGAFGFREEGGSHARHVMAGVLLGARGMGGAKRSWTWQYLFQTVLSLSCTNPRSR